MDPVTIVMVTGLALSVTSTVCSALSASFPDNKRLAGAMRVVNALALNFGRAKNDQSKQ